MPSHQCLVCGHMLLNEALVPSKMNRLFASNHPSLQTNNVNYLQSNANESKS